MGCRGITSMGCRAVEPGESGGSRCDRAGWKQSNDTVEHSAAKPSPDVSEVSTDDTSLSMPVSCEASDPVDSNEVSDSETNADCRGMQLAGLVPPVAMPALDVSELPEERNAAEPPQRIVQLGDAMPRAESNSKPFEIGIDKEAAPVLPRCRTHVEEPPIGPRSCAEVNATHSRSALGMLGVELQTRLCDGKMANLEVDTPRDGTEGGNEECHEQCTARRSQKVNIFQGIEVDSAKDPEVSWTFSTPTRSCLPNSARKGSGNRVSFTGSDPEVKLIEGLESRRAELRAWHIAELIEMRRQAIEDASRMQFDPNFAFTQMHIDPDSEALLQMGTVIDQPPFRLPVHDIESTAAPVFGFWCCSTRHEEYAPCMRVFNSEHFSENQILEFESQMPSGLSPRQVKAVQRNSRRHPCQRDVCA